MAVVFARGVAGAAGARGGARRVGRGGARLVAARAEGEEAASAPAAAAAEEASVSAAVAAADEAWKEGEAEVRMQATVVASVDAGGLIDPADGTIAEGAPLGDDNSLLDSLFGAFKDARSIEVLNGRAAMLGWNAALFTELTKNTSLLSQVTRERTFNMYDGTVIHSTTPAAGAFMVPLVVLLVLAGSLVPKLKATPKNGLDTEADAYGPFKPESEMTNGRAAMVGLPALLLVENMMGSALF